MYRAQVLASSPNNDAADGRRKFALTVTNDFGFDIILASAAPAIEALKAGDWIVYEKDGNQVAKSVVVLPPAKLEFSQAQSADEVRKALDQMVKALKADNPLDVDYPASPSTRKRLAEAIFRNLRALREQYSLADDHPPIPDFIVESCTVPPGFDEFVRALSAPLPV